MRTSIAACVVATILAGTGSAQAGECPGHPNALGVSRTIVLDPAQHPRLGTLQYDESLPLNDHEVVLTFDDGPLPPYTNRVLDTLAAECVKATFFLVGRMAAGYPHIVQREFAEGHTIAGHSQDHPFTFAKMSIDQASQEIEDGFQSVRNVLEIPRRWRHSSASPDCCARIWSRSIWPRTAMRPSAFDFLADDWTHIRAKEIVRRALKRIEARHRGILLLHDIQPATAAALPTLLAELKARGYKIVQVVPATPDRPATVAKAEDWVQAHHTHAPAAAPVVANGGPPGSATPSPQMVRAALPGDLLSPALLGSAETDTLSPRPALPAKASHPVPAADIAPLPAPSSRGLQRRSCSTDARAGADTRSKQGDARQGHGDTGEARLRCDAREGITAPATPDRPSAELVEAPDQPVATAALSARRRASATPHGARATPRHIVEHGLGTVAVPVARAHHDPVAGSPAQASGRLGGEPGPVDDEVAAVRRPHDLDRMPLGRQHDLLAPGMPARRRAQLGRHRRPTGRQRDQAHQK